MILGDLKFQTEKVYREILKFQIGRFAKKSGDTSEIGRYLSVSLRSIRTHV